MKLTNRLNLPQPIVDAVAADDYSSGGADISVTELIQPPRLAALRRAHADALVEDVADRIYVLMGTAIHGILEQLQQSGDIAEQRFSLQTQGWTLSGQVDHFAGGILTDYKTAGVGRFARSQECPPEWEQQTNCYASLLDANGHLVQSLRIVCLLQGWVRSEALRNPAYPQQQVLIFEPRLWSTLERATFIKSRIVAHQEARAGALPLCTDEDRWARPTKWAVKKQGRQTAVKVFDDELLAKSWLLGQKDASQLFIEERPGAYVRCESWCPVAAFCTQHQQKQAF